MLLGKRPRPPMKRTTSMNEITFDLNSSEATAACDPQNNPCNTKQKPVVYASGGPQRKMDGNIEGLDERILATVSPRNGRRHSTDFMETPHFLRACGLCKRRLVPGRDIYMYRGDTAFCSLECRQQQMNQDERKEKCSLASKKEDGASSTKGETVAAL